MTINTKRRANSIKTRFLGFAFITVALVAALFYFSDYVKQKEIPLAVLILGGLIYVFYMFKKYTYIEYSDDGNMIILRYFKLVPSTLDHHAIEIPKQTFIGYEVKDIIMGLREDIILIQQTKNGIAKYPPVSLSILNNAEIQLLKNSLTQLSRK
ncbi:MAG: hypothetical protein K9H64_05310 [Bacteroidales bacterium]|nr:hypothetical protein [Bacteroidales bacterium]MCF8455257.1 hypothetical protein [Bacteroidales bacterium]